MTFKEFLNQKDHKPHALAMKPPQMGMLQVIKAFKNDDMKSSIPDMTQPPECPHVHPARPSISPLLGSGRSFITRLKTTPRKPTEFLPRKSPSVKKI
jgi:hypothetical protein